MRRTWLAWVILILLSPHGGTCAVDFHSAFADAQKLAHDGKTEEAFLKFLDIPGGEYAAVSLARENAKDFLGLLRKDPRTLESPRARLVEAELSLTSEP